ILVVLASILVFANIPNWHYPPVYPYMLGFFVLTTLLVYYFMLGALHKRPARFVSLFMLTTMLKLFAYLIFMVVYALLHREVAMPFIISFFLLYIIYTVVEVVCLLRVNRILGHDTGLNKRK
ncbi:MAG TPA: hypothetical protein VK994_05845, partial [Bacteroidales bacterium]|nr:hypothetical protein [Bacteroidales bacterium]